MNCFCPIPTATGGNWFAKASFQPLQTTIQTGDDSMEKKFQPVAILEKIENGQLIVRCPYCDCLHKHGIANNKITDNEFGTRVPHCTDKQKQKAGISKKEYLTDYKIKKINPFKTELWQYV